MHWESVLSGPGIALGPDRPGRSGGLEFVEVETGGVGGHDGGCARNRVGMNGRDWRSEPKERRTFESVDTG
jgi:hypothetical protein